MKIGIMLRHITQHGGGVLVYTKNLLPELLALNSSHEFVFIYNDPSLLGTYSDNPQVREVAVGGQSALLWDQIAVARLAHREKFDVLFNPKYSVPLLTDCPTVFVCHGLDWYVMPWGSKWMDRLSHNYLIPRYAKKAQSIIAVSETTRQQVIDYLKVSANHVHTVYHGIDEAFRENVSDEIKRKIRENHRLPERFFLYCGQIYPPKNFGRLLRAYAQVGPELGIPLVVAGEHRWLCGEDLELVDKLKISSWVVRPGWIGRDELPAFYSLAEALLLPSLYESFGLPLLEAMAAGCPVVTANRYGPKELVGDAGILVNPESVDSIADGIRRVATDDSLRTKLRKIGPEHVSEFNWKRCAEQTLTVLESAASNK